MLLHLFVAHSSGHHLSTATIAPVYLVVGALALISGLFFIGLPKAAGEGLHGVPGPNARAAT